MHHTPMKWHGSNVVSVFPTYDMFLIAKELSINIVMKHFTLCRERTHIRRLGWP